VLTTIDAPAISHDPRLVMNLHNKITQLQMMFTTHGDGEIQGRKTETRVKVQGPESHTTHAESGYCCAPIMSACSS